MRFGTWNVGSMYRAGSFTASSRELARYKLDLVGGQEGSWDTGSTIKVGDYSFFNGKEKENRQLGGYFVHHRIVSPVKRAEFVSDRMSHIVMRVRWCIIIFLNVHASREEESDDSEDIFLKNYSRFFLSFS